jgi:hypothetical protein
MKADCVLLLSLTITADILSPEQLQYKIFDPPIDPHPKQRFVDAELTLRTRERVPFAGLLANMVKTQSIAVSIDTDAI